MIIALIALVVAAGVALVVALLMWRRRPRGVYLPRQVTKGRIPPAVRRSRAPSRKAMVAHRRGKKAFRR